MIILTLAGKTWVYEEKPTDVQEKPILPVGEPK